MSKNKGGKYISLLLIGFLLTTSQAVQGAEKKEEKASKLKEIVIAKPGSADSSKTSGAATKEEENTVVVTGSRIRRLNEAAAIPVQVLRRQEIEEIGTVDLGEVLAEIPGVDQGLSPENTANQTQNSGLSAISVRRLGTARTLTLIDGRRVISNSGNGERVNLSTIPSGFVDSVEVTTGGASAIYGSDAIGGVANIILRDDWEGVELRLRSSAAESSGEQEKTVDFTYGKEFDQGRAYTLFAISYDDESAIFADKTRPLSIANVEFNAPLRSRLPGFEDDPNAFGSELGFGNCDNSGRFCINPSGSSNLPGGLFEGDDAWNIGGVWFNDQSLLPNDGRLGAFGFETDSDGYNFREGRTLSPSAETLAIGLKSDYDLTQDVNIYARINYSSVKTTSRSAPLNASSGTDIGFDNAEGDIGTIPANHPFIPPEVEETRSGTVSWRRRFVEVGFRDRSNDRDTIRASLGLKGYTENDWVWDLSLNFGHFEQDQRYINELNFLNIRNALNIEAVSNGGFQCVDAAARAAGCLPLNIFGEGSITPAAADYIRYNGRLFQDREQAIVSGSMNGELFELDSGVVKAAFGFEHRHEQQKTWGDPDNNFERTSVTPIPNIEADFDVSEVFGELDIPLIKDELWLQVAARIADYSTVGNVNSFNLGASWQLNESLRFRTQYSRSQRAPNLTEFFSPARGDGDTLRDPCTGLNADGTGITLPAGSDASIAIITANCLAESGIQAFFANPDNAGVAFEFDGGVSGPNAGNDQLTEETADTYIVGAVITPEGTNFSLIVDYYDISVSDAIGSVSTQITADRCYSSTDTNNRFCNVITRDSSTGLVTEVLNRLENLNDFSTRGIDTTLNYDWEFPIVPGKFDLNFIYTHYLKDDFTFAGLNGPETATSLGEIGDPENEFRSRLRWSNGNWRATYSVRFYDGGVDNILTSPEDNDYFKVGSESFHNLFLNYRFKKENDTAVSVFFGINNIFDNFGPLLPVGLENGDTRNMISRLNDVEGREYYAGFRISF